MPSARLCTRVQPMGRRWAVVAGRFLRCAFRSSILRDHQIEGRSCMDVHGRWWMNLSPVSPVFGGLSPVLPGTEKPNENNRLRRFFGFVPGVPGVLGQYPKENALMPSIGDLRWITIAGYTLRM